MSAAAAIVDLRSDTVTRPSSGMRRAMAEAEVGDDVFGDDPTVNRLQEEAARLLGKEAALLVPTGTMANLICVRAHTEHGDEIILEAGSHIFAYEAAGFAAISGVSAQCVPARRGILTAESVAAAIRPTGGLSHFPVSKLVCIENTSNRGGGSVYPLQTIAEIAAVARERGLRLHLDGARIWNAAVALGAPVARIAAAFDSVSCCLSKGLGCPAGSLIAGSRAFIQRAHRLRKMLGGGMRQAGYLAAAGLFALEHHFDRLHQDHRRARELATAVAQLPGFAVDLEGVATNMVYVDVTAAGRTGADVATALAAAGVRVVAVAPMRLRAVLHLDVDDDGLARAIAAFRSVA